MKRLTIRTEVLALAVSIFFTLTCNLALWSTLADKSSLPLSQLAILFLFTAALITGIQWLLLLLVVNRWTAKPVITVLLLITAPAVYFLDNYGIYIDRSMIRNVLETDFLETWELVDWRMAPTLMLLGVIPAVVVSKIRLLGTGLKEAAFARGISLVLAAGLVAFGLLPVMDSLAPLMREHREIRYLVTPSNFVVSTVKLLAGKDKAAGVASGKTPVGLDAVQVKHAAHTRPKAFVLVVGETVRAQNWGLNGYERQTTPNLAKRDVTNFADMKSCGTDTATSLPCMFSPFGRRDYDEERIRGSESLLHVINRAGIEVMWRDNQSGCKGVCDGLLFESVVHAQDSELCSGQRCLDGILLKDLKTRIESANGDILIVLHMLGTHGPAYFQRYPEQYRRFKPTCDTTDLARCEHQTLVNTYDNGILYTDSVLDQVIAELDRVKTHETGMLYVSDHGESLGERNFYLHGLPYAIAPDEQTRVPMVIWLSERFKTSHRLTSSCLAQRSKFATSHDSVFHTILGMFDVRTGVYDPSLDVGIPCLPT